MSLLQMISGILKLSKPDLLSIKHIKHVDASGGSSNCRPANIEKSLSGLFLEQTLGGQGKVGGATVVSQRGTITVYGASDFSHFFNMAACLNVSTTSSYRCIVGLTKRSPVIPTQTLSLHNTKYHGYGKYSLTDVYGLCDFSHFFNSAARRYYTRTSCYRTLVGLTKLS